MRIRPKKSSALSGRGSETVTFLFTDIVGSTGLERKLGESYQLTLERHRTILRRAVGAHGGFFEPHGGDAGYMFFHSARSALAACVAAQKALAAEAWPEGAAVAVRMGLNTGDVEKGLDGKYGGLVINLAKRISDVAHGGQVLLSDGTRAAARETLPQRTTLKNLGSYWLKGFEEDREPVRLFQLCHPDLREDFEPPGLPETGGPEPRDNGRTRTPSSPPPPKFEGVYRSPSTPPGAFRVPGDFHVHIDGGSSAAAVFQTLRDLEGRTSRKDRPRFPMKANAILNFRPGPQRDDRAFVQTYRFHTPGIERESFDAFSTMWLGRGSDLEPEAVDALEAILGSMREWPGAVVELERVIGVLESGGAWQDADQPRIADPDALTSGLLHTFPRFATSPIEIHHAIDIPKRRGSNPLGVGELPTWPNLGGWFLFEKDNHWSYRSSQFVDRSAEFRFASHEGQKRLLDFLTRLGGPFALHTLAEQVLGIWRGGSLPTDDRSSVPALGEWEISCPPDGHIWVIAPNFLGDRNPDVRKAMVRNLEQDVTYTYFLHNHADVLRLSRLANDLERDLIRLGKTADRARRTVASRVRCLLLDSGHSRDEHLRALLADDYFLCPSHPAMGGFRLDSSGFSGERVDSDEYDYLVRTLGPLLNTTFSDLFSSTWTSRSSNQVVVCTELEGSGIDQDQDAWRGMLSSYDHIVAGKVSMHGAGCEVVRPVRNGYLLVFEDPREAAEWARRLQFEVQWHNENIVKQGGGELPIPTHNIALGYGSVTRILRAHGHDFVGGSIDECIRLVDTLRGGQIAMSRMFADQFEARVGSQELAASTRVEADYLVGDLRILDWP